MSDEQESIDLFGEMHPYNKLFPVYTKLPEKGMDEEEILKEIAYMSEEENKKWQGGQCSGTMYHGGMEHYAFLNRVFSHVLLRQSHAAGPVPKRDQIRGGSAGDGGQDAAR